MIKATTILLLLLVMAPLPSPGAEAPFGIDLRELERPKSAVHARREREHTKKERGSAKKRRRSADSARSNSKTAGYLRYSVKPGDHLFKILAGRLGMPDETAEQLIPEIVRINKIRDIKSLSVGQTLLIPHRELHPAAGREEAVKPAALLDAASIRRASNGSRTAPTAQATQPPSRPPSTAPPTAATWICPVPEQDPAATVDALLTVLQISPGRNRTVEAGQEAGTAFSITADRYFEYQGGRYVVSIGESDPSGYTLLRVLETAGYQVLSLTGREDFRGAAVRLLTAVGVAPDFGRHLLQEGKEITGFLIRPEGAGGSRVVVSAERVEPGGKWLLAPGCGAR